MNLSTLRLDATDLQILDAAPARRLADQPGARRSASTSRRATCLRRVKRWSSAASSSAASPSSSPEALGHGLTAIVEVTLDRQAAERWPRSRRAPSPRTRCSSATASRRAPTSCWSSRSPTWPAYHALVAAAVHAGRQRAQRQGVLQRPPRQVRDRAIRACRAAPAQRLRTTRPFRYSPSGKVTVIGWSGAAPRRA